MAREGGIFGHGGIGERVLEAGVKRALGVDLEADADARERLVESSTELRLYQRLTRRLAWTALSAINRSAIQGQDEEPNERIGLARRVREIARKDSQMLYAVRLRNAFCFGQGVPEPIAVDEELGELLKDTWTAPINQAELTSPEAQWRNGKDLWENANLYPVVFAGLSAVERASGNLGLDGLVLLGSLQHDAVRDVQRDPENWRRVLYYVCDEYVYEWDYDKHAPKPQHGNQKRTVYYESLEGMAELEAEVAAGRTRVPAPPPPRSLRPGRVMHVAINRGKEQAFGEPEMRTNLRWAGAFNDILAGQVEKAKSAQSYLMKVRAKGARSQQQLEDMAMKVVGRRSPLGIGQLSEAIDEPPPPLGGPVGRPRPGGQWWENESLDAEPFNLDSGGDKARYDMESASQAFATGTNFPGHYFFGDPGSLAGSMAVELPVLKLTEVDQELFRGVFRRFLQLRIDRAVAVGLISERRALTQEELDGGREPDSDGMIERDLTFKLDMPDPLRRNLPELMALVTDTVASFDPLGTNKPLKRALLSYVLSELLDVSDAAALVERIMTEDANDEAERLAAEQAAAEAASAAAGGDPTFTGADGKQHTSANPYGAKRQSQPVVEAEVRGHLERVARAILAEAEAEEAAAAAVTNGGTA